MNPEYFGLTTGHYFLSSSLVHTKNWGRFHGYENDQNKNVSYLILFLIQLTIDSHLPDTDTLSLTHTRCCSFLVEKIPTAPQQGIRELVLILIILA